MAIINAYRVFIYDTFFSDFFDKKNFELRFARGGNSILFCTTVGLAVISDKKILRNHVIK